MVLFEERHYPKFLDSFKKVVIDKIINLINYNSRRNIFSFMDSIMVENEYCNNILISITINPNGEITDEKAYNAYYYNQYDELYDGKIYNPIIIVNCPCHNGEVNCDIIRYCVSHELTHLYDDWQALSNGKCSLVRQDRIVDSNNLVKNLMNSNDKFEKGMGFLIYLSLKTEQKAFLSQTVQELESNGCDKYNYIHKMKLTALYRNITKSYKTFYDGIINSDDKKLLEFNNIIFNSFPKSNIPKYDIKSLNIEKYKKTLYGWADRLYRKIIKNYGSVVSYYLDSISENLKRHNCLYVI